MAEVCIGHGIRLGCAVAVKTLRADMAVGRSHRTHPGTQSRIRGLHCHRHGRRRRPLALECATQPLTRRVNRAPNVHADRCSSAKGSGSASSWRAHWAGGRPTLKRSGGRPELSATSAARGHYLHGHPGGDQCEREERGACSDSWPRRPASVSEPLPSDQSCQGADEQPRPRQRKHPRRGPLLHSHDLDGRREDADRRSEKSESADGWRDLYLRLGRPPHVRGRWCPPFVGRVRRQWIDWPCRIRVLTFARLHGTSCRDHHLPRPRNG